MSVSLEHNVGIEALFLGRIIKNIIISFVHFNVSPLHDVHVSVLWRSGVVAQWCCGAKVLWGSGVTL